MSFSVDYQEGVGFSNAENRFAAAKGAARASYNYYQSVKDIIDPVEKSKLVTDVIVRLVMWYEASVEVGVIINGLSDTITDEARNAQSFCSKEQLEIINYHASKLRPL